MAGHITIIVIWTIVNKTWRDGRVVDCGGLENRYPFAWIVGSNPTLSSSFYILIPTPFLILNLTGRTTAIILTTNNDYEGLFEHRK